MVQFYKKIMFILFVMGLPTLARDVILELKGSYFLPTNSDFRDCYKGSVLYGPELTVQLKEAKNWYAFASLDYYKQKGRFLSICDSTTLRLLPLALGIKYFIPIRDRADFYFGLGFEPIYINKKLRRKLVTAKESHWGFGGIGKVGAYIHMPHNFLLDIFVDYSFAWTSKNNFYGNTTLSSRTNLSGAIFGAGLGYRF